MTIYQRIYLTSSRDRFLLMLMLSFLTHLLIVSNIYLKPIPVAPTKTIKIALKNIPTPLTKPVIPLHQFVSPSPKTDSPKDPHYLSDNDSATTKEQIKRGQLDARGSTPTPHNNVSLHKSVINPHRLSDTFIKAPPKSSNNQKLFLDSKEMEKTILSQQQQKNIDPKSSAPNKTTTNSDQLRGLEFTKALPFERQSNKSLFSGPIGSPDYLPNIPDGDITLLNSKADQFAVFVRRVALQVFGAIKRKNWQELSASELRRLNNFSTIHAKMNKSGQLIAVELQDSSGSILFDNLVKESVELSATDQNPPAAAAAEDGYIHFIFKSRSWSRLLAGRGNEQRWILLGTGLL